MDFKRIKNVVATIVRSSTFKRALWNFMNAIIVLTLTTLADAGIIEAGIGFAILNGITKELNIKYGNI